ncbi:hypothetical protein [Stutzerimonas stutzeri]|uniref:hypothetical protein n=1 Tax=Stutzerimonas stutzeri TaxID=316 RepID=UPI001BCDE5C7|nr:hypothetical protein [Stutzerimonas stutzeri]
MPAHPSSDLLQAPGHARVVPDARCTNRTSGTDSSHRDEVPEASQRRAAQRR